MASKKRSGKQKNNLSVGEFYKNNCDELGLSLQGSDIGFNRLIKEPVSYTHLTLPPNREV